MTRGLGGALSAFVLLGMLAAPPAASAAAGDPAAAAEPAVAAPPPPVGFQAVTPTRVFDARGRTPLAPGRPQEAVVAGVAGVPTTGVGAVVLSVSTFDALLPTQVTVAPKGGGVAAQIATTPLVGNTNDVVLPLGTEGRVTFATTAARTGVTAHVVGWYPTADFVAVPAARVLDTARARAPLASNRPVDVAVAGVGGVPTSGVAAVVLAVRASQPTTATGVSVAPTGSPAPTGRQLSAVPLLDTSNEVVVPLGTDGKVTFRVQAGRVTVAADVVGWIPSTSTFSAVAPVRVLDTARTRTPLAAGRPLDVTVTTGVTLPPAGVTAVVLQLNGGDATASGAVSVQRTGAPTTTRTALTHTLLLPTANQVVVPVDETGRVTFAASQGQVQLTVDVVGLVASPELPPPTDGSWRFEPSIVNLSAAGETATVRLVHVDAKGLVTPHLPPSSVTTALVGDAAATVTRVERGVYRITATATVGQTLVTTANGGTAPFAAPLDVTNARLQPGVVTVPADKIVFPLRGVPVGVDPVVAGGYGATATGVGPFTWAELQARFVGPKTDPNDPTAILDPDQTAPWVLVGAAPPVGTVVLTGGDRHYGRVVELAGRPAITRDGHTLITVRLGNLLDVYTELRSGLTDAQLDLLEVAAPAPTTTAAATATTARAPFGKSRLTTPMLAADDAGPCSVTGGISITNVSPTAQVDPSGSFITAPTPQVSGGRVSWRMRVRVETTTTLGVTALLGLSASGTLSCTLVEPKPVIIPAAGWLSGIVSLGVKPALGFEANLTVQGGPRLGFNYTCVQRSVTETTFTFTQTAGLPVPLIARDTSSDVNVPPEPCPTFKDGTVTFGAGSNASDDSPLQVTGFLGLFASTTYSILPFPALNGLLDYVPTVVEELADGLDFAELKVTLGFKVAWENTRSVLEAATGSAYASFELAFSGTLKITAFVWLSEKLSGIKGQISADLQLFNVPIGLTSYYRTTNAPDHMQLTIDGTSTTGDGQKVQGHVGSSVALDATMGYNQVVGRPNTGDWPVTGAKAWLQNGTAWVELTELPLTVAGTRVTGTLPVTKALCDRLGPDGSTIMIVTDVPMGSVPTPGYGGKFTLRCDGELAWEPTTLSLSATKKTAPTPVNAKGKGLNGATFTATAPLAPWLTVTPSTGTFPSADASVPLQVVADCDVLAPSTSGQSFITLATDTPNVPSANLLVSLSCTDDYFQFQPASITGGGSANLVNRFAQASTWTVTSKPEWATVSPTSGSLAGGPSTTAVSVSVTKRTNTFCEVSLPARSGSITAKRSDGQTAILSVTDPSVPPKQCGPRGPSTTSFVWGDPHLGSFDGNRFDAQVRGEYVYFRPTDPAASEPALYVRFENTTASTALTAQPTSVTAVLYRSGGHTVELYQRPASPVLVDGVPYTDESGAPYEVAPGLSLSVTPTSIVVADGDATVQIHKRSSGPTAYLDVYATVAQGTPVAGLLGSPDGIAANDFTSAAGAVITSDSALAHGAAFYTFTDSWRIARLADSPFSRTYAGFADVNPVYDTSVLEPYRQQVLAQLGPITSACDVGAGGWSLYQLNALALELYIGQPLSALPQFTCTFVVQGTTRAAGTNEAVGNVRVTLDAPGLAPCVTTADTTGAFVCYLSPSLDELTASPASFPLVVTATASWTPGGPPVATGTASFAAPVPVAAGAPPATIALVVDPASFPMLRVTGTMLGTAGPLTDVVPVTIEAFDASGSRVLSRRVDVLPGVTDGAYAVAAALPGTAARVELVAQIGAPVDWVRRTVTGVVPGANAVTFDVVYRPNVLTLSGSFTENGVRLPGPIRLVAAPSGPGVGGSFIATVVPGTDGAYTAEITLPAAATSAVVTAEIGVLVDRPSVTVSGLVGGSRAVPFSFDHRPTTLTMSGTLLWLGQPTGAQFVFAPRNVAGSPLGTYYASAVGAPGTGAYSVTVALPMAAASTDVYITYTRPGEGTSSLSFGVPLTSGQANARSFSIDPVVLRVTGRVTQSGAPLPVGSEVRLDVNYFDASGAKVGGLSGNLSYDLFGTYRIEALMPATVVSAEIVLNGGEARHTLTGFQVGLNARTIDLDLVPLGAPVVVSGTVRQGGAPAGGGSMRFDVASYRVAATANAVPPYTLLDDFFVDGIPVAPDGTYRTTIYLPVGASFATVRAEHDSGDGESTGGLRVDLPGPKALTLDVELGRRSFRLWGAARACAATPYVPRVQAYAFDTLPPVDYDAATATWPGGELVFDALVVPDPADGSFSVGMPVADGRTAVGVRWSLEGSPTPQAGTGFDTRLFPIDPFGAVDVGTDLELGCPQDAPSLTVTGTVHAEGVPASGGTLWLEVVPAQVIAPWNVAPSFERLTPILLTDVVVAADGTYSATVTMPPGTTFASVRIREYDGELWDRPVGVGVLPGPNALALDLDTTARTFSLDGTALVCQGNPYVPRLELYAFPSLPGGYDPGTGTWPGGTRVYGALVVPDPVTGAYRVETALPADTTHVGMLWTTGGTPIELPFGQTSVVLVEIGPSGSASFGGWNLEVCGS